MSDPTESIRRLMVDAINSAPATREQLEEAYGADNVWDTAELTAAFTVISFAAPFAMVRRTSDGAKGAVEFQHRPRFYYEFTPEGA